MVKLTGKNPDLRPIRTLRIAGRRIRVMEIDEDPMIPQGRCTVNLAEESEKEPNPCGKPTVLRVLQGVRNVGEACSEHSPEVEKKIRAHFDAVKSARKKKA